MSTSVGSLAETEWPAGFDRRGIVETVVPPNRIGHNLGDTMWPWNGDLNPPRPNFALGGTMAPSPCVGAPGPKPKVQDVFDYQGSVIRPTTWDSVMTTFRSKARRPT